jgi:hypothetical protein
VRGTKTNSAGMTKKNIDIKLKAATLEELRAFVRKILSNSSPALNIIAEFNSFSPKATPIQPSPDDPLLAACCVCLCQEAPCEFPGVTGARLCADHHEYYVQQGKGFTRDSACHTFGFSKKEAEAIPHKAIIGGFYRSKIFIYQPTSVLRAAVKKYGSLYMMMRHRCKPHTVSAAAGGDEDIANVDKDEEN